MTQHRQILNFLSILKDSHPSMENIFTKGSCMNLFQLLKTIHPQAEAYYDSDHIVTKIGKYMYDVNGVVVDNGYYVPFTSYHGSKGTSRAFAQMSNGMLVEAEAPNSNRNNNTSDEMQNKAILAGVLTIAALFAATTLHGLPPLVVDIANFWTKDGGTFFFLAFVVIALIPFYLSNMD